MTVNFILGKYTSNQHGGFVFDEAIVVVNSTTISKNVSYMLDTDNKIKQTVNETANYNFSVYPSLASFKNGGQPIGHSNLHLSTPVTTDVDMLQGLINSNKDFTDFTQQTMRI